MYTVMFILKIILYIYVCIFASEVDILQFHSFRNNLITSKNGEDCEYWITILLARNRIMRPV